MANSRSIQPAAEGFGPAVIVARANSVARRNERSRVADTGLRGPQGQAAMASC